VNATQQIVPKPGKNLFVQIHLNRCHHDIMTQLDGDPGYIGVEGPFAAMVKV
jgi:hypothetical protein